MVPTMASPAEHRMGLLRAEHRLRLLPSARSSGHGPSVHASQSLHLLVLDQLPWPTPTVPSSHRSGLSSCDTVPPSPSDSVPLTSVPLPRLLLPPSSPARCTCPASGSPGGTGHTALPAEAGSAVTETT